VTKAERYTVDLSEYPDLVVIYLGMRMEEPRGLETLEELGPQIRAAVEEQPDGLLLHEELTYSQEPLHVGMRQYWRDFDSLEAWALELPHKTWWTQYLRDRGGTSFWHETYFRTGGFESMYVDVDGPVGLGLFAPHAAATGPMFSARQRRDAEQALQRPAG
jgi:hypothetical protein